MKRTLLELNGKLDRMPESLTARAANVVGHGVALCITAITLTSAALSMYVDIPVLFSAKEPSAPLRGEHNPRAQEDGVTTASVNPRKTGNGEARVEAGHSVAVPTIEEGELDILVFDATGDSRLFGSMVQILKSAIQNSQITAQFEWKNKVHYRTTRVMWQGTENRIYAECIVDWLPGQQVSDVYIPYRSTHGARYFGINATRDIVVFIGRDYDSIIEAYEKRETLTCRTSPLRPLASLG